MAKGRAGSGRLPDELLSGLVWRFEGEPIASRTAFDARVRQRQIDVHEDDSWRPGEIVLRSPRVRVEYFGVSDPDDEEYQDFEVDLASDNGEYFTAGELLFKLHNAVVAHLRDTDHCQFEGLVRGEDAGEGAPPVYEMTQGS